MANQSPDIFAYTSPAGTPAVAALIGPNQLLASSTFASTVGEQFTLSDGNTATVADTSGSFSLLHLTNAESATPLSLGQLTPNLSNIPGTLAPTNGPTVSETFTTSDTDYLTGASPTSSPAAFLNADGTSLYGLSQLPETDYFIGQEVTGPALSASSVPTVQGWLAADEATQSTTAGNNNPPTGGSPSDYHTPASSAAAAFTETVNGAPGNQQGILYSGPVADLYYQLVVLTPGNINVMTHSPGCFVSTGAGNDAIALNSGTNVVDAGGGSNFLTSGSGFDTFFLDARNIPVASSAAGPVPGAVWDTVQGFGHGDAVTLWGIGPGTALAWQKNEGAVGHTGLTLHANMPNGSEASLTLAGVSDASHLALSYGQSGGASYLYVKAV